MLFIDYAASSFSVFAVGGFEETGLEVVGLDDVTDGLEETVPGLDEVPLGLDAEEGGEEVTVSSGLLDTDS